LSLLFLIANAAMESSLHSCKPYAAAVAAGPARTPVSAEIWRKSDPLRGSLLAYLEVEPLS
jgi:hypothetical protein